MKTHSQASRIRFVLIVSIFFLAFSTFLSAQSNTDADKPAPKIDWHQGPYIAKLDSVAEIKVPAGYEFADGDGARRYLEITHNPPEGTEIGILTPMGKRRKTNG
jgi:hypothetical protein